MAKSEIKVGRNAACAACEAGLSMRKCTERGSGDYSGHKVRRGRLPRPAGWQPAAPRLFVWLVADVFQPIHGLAIERFLNGDVRHRGGGPGAMPMLLVRRKLDD